MGTAAGRISKRTGTQDAKKRFTRCSEAGSFFLRYGVLLAPAMTASGSTSRYGPMKKASPLPSP
jgi:hypothetical protein